MVARLADAGVADSRERVSWFRGDMARLSRDITLQLNECRALRDSGTLAALNQVSVEEAEARAVDRFVKAIRVEARELQRKVFASLWSTPQPGPSSGSPVDDAVAAPEALSALASKVAKVQAFETQLEAALARDAKRRPPGGRSAAVTPPTLMRLVQLRDSLIVELLQDMVTRKAALDTLVGGGDVAVTAEADVEPTDQLAHTVAVGDTMVMRLLSQVHTQFVGVEALVKTLALSTRGVSDTMLLMQLQEANARLEAQVKEAREHLALTQQRCELLTADIQLRGDARQQAVRLDAAVLRIRDLQHQHRGALLANARLTTEVGAKDEALRALEAKLADATSQIAHMRDAIEPRLLEVESTGEKSKESVEGALSTLSLLVPMFGSQTSKIDALVATLSSVTKERDELRARVDVLSRLHEESSEEAARLRELSRRLAAAHASLTGEHRMLRRAVAERMKTADATVAALKNRVQVLEREPRK